MCRVVALAVTRRGAPLTVATARPRQSARLSHCAVRTYEIFPQLVWCPVAPFWCTPGGAAHHPAQAAIRVRAATRWSAWRRAVLAATLGGLSACRLPRRAAYRKVTERTPEQRVVSSALQTLYE